MSPKTIKVGKREDIASVIKQIKSLKDREVIFQLEKGSSILYSSDNMKLMKRTGESLGKIVKVDTNDEIGMILAKKAGVLLNDVDVKMPRASNMRVARSDVKPRFSDILGSRKIFSKVAAKTEEVFKPQRIISASIMPSMPSISFGFTGKLSKLLFSGLAVLIVLIVGVAVLLPRADITVFGRSEQISRDLEITVDKNITSVNSDNLQVPGVSVSREVSLTKNFKTAGVKLSGNKATGSVTIFNFTKNTLTLKATTTTLVFNGKKYFFTKDITGIKPNGVPTPDVQIVAEQAGDTYALAAESKFQIVNTALGSQNVYALNPQAISVAAATSSNVLSQQDLDTAAASLSNEVIAQAEADLSAETGTKTILVPTGVTKEILAKTANKNVEDTADNFDMTLIAKVVGLSFKEDDVTGVVLAKINEVLSSDKYLLDTAEKKYTAEFRSIDIPSGHGVLAVHFETTAAYKIDTANLAKLLAGKNETEIKEILLSKPEIDNVRVKFWPAWFVSHAPRINGKIYINTVLSQN